MLLQQTAAQRLKSIKDRRSRKLNPVLRGAAKQLFELDQFEMIISGPAETGKTFAALYFLDSFLRNNPNTVGLLVRDTLTSIYKTVLRSYLKLIAFYNDTKPYGGSKPEWFDYPNGSQLYLGGLDKPENVLSGEYDIICINQTEGISLEAYEILLTRATGRSGNADKTYVIGDCNPGNKNHWILHRSQINLLHSKHTDNPTLYNEDGTLTQQGIKTISILEGLSGIRRKRLYEGLWVSAEGIIYEYDPAIHLINSFKIPDHWLRLIVIDFGFRNPFVAQWWALDPDNKLYMYREIYQTGLLVEDAAKLINQYSANENIYVVIADHDAEDRATLLKYGIDTIPANKTVKLGIEAVQTRLKVQLDGKPSLFFLKDALVHDPDTTLEEMHKPTSTVDEIDSYEWSNKKEEPIKLNDHGMDGMRYLVAFVDSIGQELQDHTDLLVYNDPVLISPY